MIRITLTAALAALALTAYAPAAVAQQGEAAFRATTLNLTAQGEIRTQPEIVTLHIGATFQAATAREAMAEANRRINSAVEALRKSGVAARDVQTQRVQLEPHFDSNGRQPYPIDGYVATTRVSVVVRQPSRAGEFLDIAMAAGANQVHGLRYGLIDSAAAQREARDLALKALQEDAQRVADRMGQRIVRLVSVSSHGWGQVMPANRIEEVVVTGSRIETGELVVRTSVNGVYELAPK